MKGYRHSQQGLNCRNMLQGARVLKKYGGAFAETQQNGRKLMGFENKVLHAHNGE